MGSATPERSDTEDDNERLARLCRVAIADTAEAGVVSLANRAPLALAVRALAPAVPSDRPYGRRELYTSAEGEVMLASWRPGASSAPHDHGRSRGFVIVLEGAFEEHAFALRAGPTRLEKVQDARGWRRGDGIVVRRGPVHALTCIDGGLTLHVYAGPPGPFRIYDVTRRETHVARGGAWLPPDETLTREPWDAS